MNIIIKVFAAFGLIAVLLVSLGLYLDIREMDHTEGGYEAPYTGVTGTPIDWHAMDLTATGLVRRGHVLNFIVNGTTGMISLEMFGISFKARQLSERAIAVHKPRQAFIERGFSPEF